MWNDSQLALLREAGIASNALSAGLGALRKANYAHSGLYGQAFFNLSIGFERTLKIIYILHFLHKQRRTPTNEDLKTLGHDIDKLFMLALEIQREYGVFAGNDFRKPNNIEYEIMQFLTRFARFSRYYNLDLLTDRHGIENSMDPIKDWAINVGKLILSKHLTGKKEALIRARAHDIDKLIGVYARVLHTAEDGRPLEDIFSASYETGLTEIVRKYSTFHTARSCRVLYSMISQQVHTCQNDGFSVPYLTELFFPFRNDDKYLLGRKTFPPPSQ